LSLLSPFGQDREGFGFLPTRCHTPSIAGVMEDVPRETRPAPPASTKRRETTINAHPDDKNAWLQRFLIAAITGLVSGTARALIAWALNH